MFLVARGSTFSVLAPVSINCKSKLKNLRDTEMSLTDIQVIGCTGHRSGSSMPIAEKAAVKCFP